MDISQYMTMFLEESIENLQSLNDLLLKLEKKRNDINILEEIFRIAHTIKGMAGAMGFIDIVELTHKMEDVLSKFKNGTIKITQEIITVLFICLDTLEKMTKNISDNIEEKIEIDEIIKRLEEINEYADIEKEKKYNSGLSLNEYDLSMVGQVNIEGFRRGRENNIRPSGFSNENKNVTTRYSI